MTPQIAITQDGGIFDVRFNRPDKKNALTGAMYDAIVDVFAEADANNAAAIVLSGEGGVFTSGNDIGDFMAHAGKGGDFPALRFIRALAALQTPLVAAVEGPAIGVGTTMLFHCDLVYAGADAQFRMPFVDLALVPEAGASLLAPQRIGAAKANEMLLLGEAMDAQTAKDLGLVNAIAPSGAVRDLAMEQARRLAAKPRNALRTARRLMRGDQAVMQARIDEEALLFRDAMASPEAAQAFAAFFARSKN